MQQEPTRGLNLLDLLCCNKPSLVKACISIPGISDHITVLADCDGSNIARLHVVEPPRGIYFIWKIGVNSSIQDRRQVNRDLYRVESVVCGNADSLLN